MTCEMYWECSLPLFRRVLRLVSAVPVFRLLSLLSLPVSCASGQMYVLILQALPVLLLLPLLSLPFLVSLLSVLHLLPSQALPAEYQMWKEVFDTIQLQPRQDPDVPIEAPPPRATIPMPPSDEAPAGAIVPFVRRVHLMPVEDLPSFELVDLAPSRAPAPVAPSAAGGLMIPPDAAALLAASEAEDLAAAARAPPLPAGCGQISREAKAKVTIKKSLKKKKKAKSKAKLAKAKAEPPSGASAAPDVQKAKGKAKAEPPSDASAAPDVQKAKGKPKAQPPSAASAAPDVQKAKGKPKGKAQPKGKAKNKGKAKAKAELKNTRKCVNSRAYHAELRKLRLQGVPDELAKPRAVEAGHAAVAAAFP